MCREGYRCMCEGGVQVSVERGVGECEGGV